MTKFNSTLLPQSNDPPEIQKSILDLLKKINTVAENVKEVDNVQEYISEEVSKTTGRVISSYSETDDVNRSFSTAWADGKTWTNYTFQGNSKLHVELHIPMRNDSSSWGGGYTELQYSVNGGAFVSLGHSGYDGPMSVTSNIIPSVNYQFLIDVGTIEPYTCQFKCRHKAYDGTLTVNGNHDISGDEFFSKIIILEISKGQQIVPTITPNAFVRNYFYRYNTTANVANQYIHLKTNQTINSIMNTVNFQGYAYGASKPIDAWVSYYPYGGTGTVINVGTYGSHPTNAYKSADGYVVITLYTTSTYFIGFVLSQIGAGPQGLFPLEITASRYTSSPTGAY